MYKFNDESANDSADLTNAFVANVPDGKIKDS